VWGHIGGTSGTNSVPADGCTREIRPILAVLSRRDGAVTPVELHGKEGVNGSSPLEGFFWLNHAGFRASRMD
jgi:hypothetical protein